MVQAASFAFTLGAFVQLPVTPSDLHCAGVIPSSE
jgi:hypothetical protein